MFCEEDLEMIYAACIAYGNKLSDMAKNVPDEKELSEKLGARASDYYALATRVTEYLK
jgi:hypothetical protein